MKKQEVQEVMDMYLKLLSLNNTLTFKGFDGNEGPAFSHANKILRQNYATYGILANPNNPTQVPVWHWPKKKQYRKQLKAYKLNPPTCPVTEKTIFDIQ